MHCTHTVIYLLQVYYQCEANVWSASTHYTLEAARPVQLGVYYESMCPDSVRFFQEQLWPTWQKTHTIIKLILVPFGNAYVGIHAFCTMWHVSNSLIIDVHACVTVVLQEHKDGDKWVFQCQHGPDECTGNIIHVGTWTDALHDWLPSTYNTRTSKDLTPPHTVDCYIIYLQTCALELLGDVNVSFPFIQCMMTSASLPQESAPKVSDLSFKWPVKNSSQGSAFGK